jgi:hypothetical protein
MSKTRPIVWGILAALLAMAATPAVARTQGQIQDQAVVSPFEDVPNTDPFAESIEWLAEEGITKGCNPRGNDSGSTFTQK